MHLHPRMPPHAHRLLPNRRRRVRQVGRVLERPRARSALVTPRRRRWGCRASRGRRRQHGGPEAARVVVVVVRGWLLLLLVVVAGAAAGRRAEAGEELVELVVERLEGGYAGGYD